MLPRHAKTNLYLGRFLFFPLLFSVTATFLKHCFDYFDALQHTLPAKHDQPRPQGGTQDNLSFLFAHIKKLFLHDQIYVIVKQINNVMQKLCVFVNNKEIITKKERKEKSST